jgi:hypothetical protein
MKAFEPEIVKLPDRKMVSVTSIGDPNDSGPYMKALYGAAYWAKMKVYKPKGVKMPLGKLTAMWPDAHIKPKNEWKGIWGVEVPDYVTEKDIVQKDPNIKVTIDVWLGGKYAEVLYLGTYSEETETIKKLHEFIEANGVKMEDVPGIHEEEYLTSPKVKEPKTIIRYRIK